MEGSKHNIAQVSISTFLTKIAIYSLGFVGSIFISRALGPTGRGTYYFPLTVTLTVFSLSTLGIEQANVYLRGSKKYRLKELFSNASIISLIIGAIAVSITLGLYFVAKEALFKDVAFQYLLVPTLVIPFSLHLMYLAGLLLLAHRQIKVNLANVVASFLQTGLLVLFFLWGRLDVLTVLLLYVLSVFVPWLMELKYMRDVVETQLRWNWPLLKESLSFGLRMHLGSILFFLNLRADVFMVKYLAGTTAVGLYSLAVMFAEMIWLLTDSLGMAVLPYQTEASLEGSTDLTMKAARTNLFLALLMSLGLSAVAYPVIRFLYGKAFVPSFAPLLFLLPGVIMMSIRRPLGGYIIKLGKPLTMSAISLLTFAANITLNVFMIPRWGISGASVSSSISYALGSVVIMIWALRVSQRRLTDMVVPTRDDLRSWLKVIDPAFYRGFFSPGGHKGDIR